MHYAPWIALSLAAGAGLVGPGPGVQDLAEPEGIPWRTDLGAARVEAAAAGKPLLILVRCPP